MDNVIRNILKNRIEYFKNNDFEKIYNLYDEKSQFKEFFPTLEIYKEHFFKLSLELCPEDIEIYSVNINKEEANVLFLEKVKYLDNENYVCYYGLASLIYSKGLWKIIHEKRETAFK